MLTRALIALLLSTPVAAQTSVTADNSKPAAPSPSSTSAPAESEALASADALLNERKFDEAANSFKTIIDKAPVLGAAHAGYIRSLLNAEKLDEAFEAAKRGLAAAPQSSAVHAAYGDVYFRKAMLGEAEAEYKAALKLDQNDPRAVWGLGRIYSVISMHKHAKDSFIKAHDLAPGDAQITRRWLSMQEASRRNNFFLERIRKTAADAGPQLKSKYDAILAAVAEDKIWIPSKPVEKTTIHLDPIVEGSSRITGFGMKLKLNGGTALLPKLDTGASGLTIGHKLAEKAGVIKLADSHFGGIGDSGAVAAYLGWVDRITIGDIEFQNCIIEVSSKSDVNNESGLFGADVFNKYLITLDFEERRLVLDPLPKNANVASAEDESPDRYIAPAMQSFTKIFRFGADLVVPVVVSDKATGLFILDTGAYRNSISPDLGRQVTKMRYNESRVSGVSGYVKDVQSADKVIFQFGGMRVRSDDVTSIDFKGISRYEGTEISGLIGIRTLVQMKMTIDYRDGLVKFEPYTVKPARD